MEYYKTFGQMLAQMLQSKQCTLKELTERMGFKSANTIARIIGDKTSEAKLREFCDALFAQNPLELVEHERELLRESIEVTAMGQDAYAAQKQMLHFVSLRMPQPACVCAQEFGKTGSVIATFDDLMASYTAYTQVHIMLQNAAQGGVMQGVKTLLDQSGKAQITLEHYVNTSEKHAQEIEDFLNLLDVMGHPDYHLFQVHSQQKTEDDELNVYNNMMVVLKCDADGGKWTDVVSFSAKNSFTVLHNVPGEEPYRFHRSLFSKLRMQHYPLKSTHRNPFSLQGVFDHHRGLLALESEHALVSIRPDISMCMLPPDIDTTVVSDLVDKRAPDSDARFAEYKHMQRLRYELYRTHNPACPKLYLFSKTGMYRFVKHGQSQANVFGLRHLTQEESRTVVTAMLEVARAGTSTQLLLLKNELNYNGKSYLLYDDEILLLDSQQGFRAFEPAQSYQACSVNAPGIVRSFAHFVRTELLTNYVHTQEETIAFLEDLLAEA